MGVVAGVSLRVVGVWKLLSSDGRRESVLRKFAVTMATCIRLLRSLLMAALKTTPVLGLMPEVMRLVVLETLATLRLPPLVTESSMCAVLLMESLSRWSETVLRVVLAVWPLLEVMLTFTTVALELCTTA